MEQYSHELSGGMKQRVMIAIALACDPRLLICDEPTTALDVTIQKQILELVGVLQSDRNMAVLFITHDLGVVAEITDQVAVMCPGETLRQLYGEEASPGGEFERGGHIVELKRPEELYRHPEHPYTRKLLAAIPRGTPRRSAGASKPGSARTAPLFRRNDMRPGLVLVLLLAVGAPGYSSSRRRRRRSSSASSRRARSASRSARSAAR